MAQLKKLTAQEVTSLEVEPFSQDTLQIVSQILNDVKKDGEKAVLEHAVRLGGEKHIYKRDEELKAAFDSLPADQQQLLQRTAARIKTFAESQKASLSPLTLAISGGQAGHAVRSVRSAGCYAPGGRYPLPSSVLMTAITARVAGVQTVWVASPKPAQITLAAAYVAGADALLRVGGAHAIAAFAYGAGAVPKVEAVVGPGNKFVTAAKQLVAGRVTIDMLAGPSECLVVVDKTSQPALVAADLIAQAEHDPDARPIVVNVIYDNENDIIKEIEAELEKQLATLSTAEVARQAIAANGFSVVVKGLDQAVEICDKLAPEHLELHIQNSSQVKDRFSAYGSLFVGPQSAEVFGDYGAGPNHVLPTGGTAKSNAGLSVFTFLKVRTWLEISDVRAASQVLDDASALAKLEGLHGHANAADIRRSLASSSSSSSSSSTIASVSPAGLFQNAQQDVIVSPERPLHISSETQDVVVKLALPKGRMEQGIFKLLNDAGLGLKVEARGYRPTMGVKGFDVKLLKPQNIVEMVNIGSRDIGFTGADLVEELGAKDITIILDTSQDKVKLVAAAPENILTPDGDIVSTFSIGGRKLVVASEYKNITQRWMAKRGLTSENSTFVHSRGATEVFPPEDADIIVDNTSTGSTLKANRLRAFDELLHSSTCMYVNTKLWNDPSPVAVAKRRQIEMLVTLLRSVLDAQSKVILEFNIEKTKLEAICKHIPAMREPTISQLHGEQGFAVKSVVPRLKLFELIPLIKQHGGSDVIVTDLHHIVQ